MEGIPLTIKGDVSPVTGHLRHDADVAIHGNVMPGFSVLAAGDLTVEGHVERAKLHAGGDILVKGIVSGRGTVLDAVGTVSAHHVVDALVSAGLDIELSAGAERSEMKAGRRVLALGAPGRVRGGGVQAGLAFEAVSVGRGAGRQCRIHVGRNPFGTDRREISERLAFAFSRIEKARRALSLGSNGSRRYIVDLATYRQLAQRLTRRLRQFDLVQASAGDCYISIIEFDDADAVVTFEDEGTRIPVSRSPREGAFEAVLRGGEVMVNPVEEERSVG